MHADDVGFWYGQEKIREALSAFDENDDNKISFEEFTAWWNKQDLKYVTLDPTHNRV